MLWLYGPQRLLTEVGTMNLFVFWHREDGELELVTPPLDGLILPGVIRQSLLEMAREWWYPIPTMENGPELARRFLRALSDIQYGRTPSDWAQPL